MKKLLLVFLVLSMIVALEPGPQFKKKKKFIPGNTVIDYNHVRFNDGRIISYHYSPIRKDLTVKR